MQSSSQPVKILILTEQSIEKLRIILEHEWQRSVAIEEAAATGRLLISYFENLSTHSIRQSDGNLSHRGNRSCTQPKT